MGDMNDICKHDDFEAYCPLCREELRAKVETLRREREELLAALLEISQVACSLSPEQKIANSAIAKVKP